MDQQHPQLAVTQIRIDSLEGLPRSFGIEELCSGVNLLHGPNAVGKSRTAAMLQVLIWPDLRKGSASVSGELQVGDEYWRVTCTERGVSYFLDGSPSSPPRGPGVSADLRDRYLLTLQQLLQSDNREFVKAIQRESAGGYDLSRARTESGLGLVEPKSRPTRLSKQYNAARSNARALQDQTTELQRKEEGLEGLKRDQAEAIRAGERIRVLEDAITYANRVDSLRLAEIALEQFETQLGQMSGNELDDVHVRRKALATAEERLAQEERSLVAATTALEASGFASGLPPETLISEMRGRLSLLEAALHTRQSEERAVERFRQIAAERRSQIGELLDDERARAIDQEQLLNLSALVRQSEQTANSARNLEELRQWLGTTEQPQNLTELRDGLRILAERVRLVADADSVELERNVRLALIASALIIVALSLLLALELNPVLWGGGTSRAPLDLSCGEETGTIRGGGSALDRAKLYAAWFAAPYRLEHSVR